jgi:PST family polysaccharide transporter
MRKLLRAVFGLGGAQVAGLLLGMVATKIMAVVVGAPGLGFYSLLRQLHDTVAGFAALGGGQGLIQGLATRTGEARSRLLATGVWLCIGGALVAAIVLLALGQPLAALVFGPDEPGSVPAIQWLALSVAVGIATNLAIFLVQANRRFKAFALGQIAASLALALLAYPVAQWALDRRAAFVVLIVVPALVQILWAILPLRRTGELGRLAQAARQAPDRDGMAHFGRFLVFGLAMLAMGTLSGTAVRALIVRHYGLEAAGHFQAAWTLGMQNLTLLLTPFMTYVYPTLAGASDPPARRAAWLDISTVIVGGALPMVVGAIVFKPLFLRIFYTAEFLPAIAVLQWMLLANYAKAISWLFAVVTYSAGNLRWYFLGEVAWNAIFAGLVLLVVLLDAPVQFIGVAFLVAYAVFLPLAAAICYRLYRLMFDARLIAVAALGTLLIIASVVLTWNETTVNWPLALGASLLAGLIGFMSLPVGRRQAVWRLARWPLRT